MGDQGQVIKNRNERYEKEYFLKSLLRDVQLARRLDLLIDCGFIDTLINFVLAQLPIYDYIDDNGDVSEAYADFFEGIEDYTIDEFYDKAIKLKGIKNDD